MEFRLLCRNSLQLIRGGCLSPDGSRLAVIDIRGYVLTVYSTTCLETPLGEHRSEDAYRLHGFTKNGQYLICTTKVDYMIVYISIRSCLLVAKLRVHGHIYELCTIENDDDNSNGGTECVVFFHKRIMVYNERAECTVIYDGGVADGANTTTTGAASKDTIAAYIRCVGGDTSLQHIHIWKKTTGVWTSAYVFVPDLELKMTNVYSMSITGAWLALNGNHTAYWRMPVEDSKPHAAHYRPTGHINEHPAYIHDGFTYRVIYHENMFTLFVCDMLSSDILFSRSVPAECFGPESPDDNIVSDNGRVMCCVSSIGTTLTLFDVTHHGWSMRQHPYFAPSIRERIMSLVLLYACPESKPSVIGLLPFELCVTLCEYVAGF